MHPARRPHQPRATAALLIAVLALVLALVGGSYAAGRYLGAAASKAKPQVRRGPRGPQGEVGPHGPTGQTGAPGEDGAPGDSVTGTELKPGDVHCPEGGTEFKTASGTVFACNGARGTKGKAGPPNL
jgi:hypothetical protein